MTNYLDVVIFFWKNYCGAPGVPISEIFATITLDPLYFEVHIFLDSLDPPYMSKNAKMCYFEHFFGVRSKKPPQSMGPPWKNLTLGIVLKFFSGPPIYVGSWPLSFRNISQWKIFHRHRQRHRHRSPVGFLRFGWKTENIIFGAEKLKIEFF